MRGIQDPTPPLAKSRARAMRRQPTDAERALWHLLRDRRLAETKWRRQVPSAPTSSISSASSIAWSSNGTARNIADSARDAARDDWLTAQGFTVSAILEHAVLKERSTVIDTILARCGLPW